VPPQSGITRLILNSGARLANERMGFVKHTD